MITPSKPSPRFSGSGNFDANGAVWNKETYCLRFDDAIFQSYERRSLRKMSLSWANGKQRASGSWNRKAKSVGGHWLFNCAKTLQTHNMEKEQPPSETKGFAYSRFCKQNTWPLALPIHFDVSGLRSSACEITQWLPLGCEVKRCTDCGIFFTAKRLIPHHFGSPGLRGWHGSCFG